MPDRDQSRHQGRHAESPALSLKPRTLPRIAPDTANAFTKLLLAFRSRHKDKALELDAREETVKVLGPAGEQLAAVTSDVVVDQILSYARQAASTEVVEDRQPQGGSPAPPLPPLRIRARVSGGREFEGTSPQLRQRGLFIQVSHSTELSDPPEPGSHVHLILSPDDGSGPFRAKGLLAWVCPRADEFEFGPGLGVYWIELSAHLLPYLSHADQPRR